MWSLGVYPSRRPRHIEIFQWISGNGLRLEIWKQKVNGIGLCPVPLVLLGFLIFGFILNWAFPLTYIPKLPGQIAGIALILASFLIGGSRIIVMRSAHTSPNPRKPTIALVEQGIFRYTRNPLYLSMLVLFLGIAIFTTSLWLILLVPLLFLIADRGAVKPEESYLERKFGQMYLEYKKRVPRWL
jgi:protein-S-isoprenylcysteine O-methyltransferase Ste14